MSKKLRRILAEEGLIKKGSTRRVDLLADRNRVTISVDGRRMGVVPYSRVWDEIGGFVGEDVPYSVIDDYGLEDRLRDDAEVSLFYDERLGRWDA